MMYAKVSNSWKVDPEYTVKNYIYIHMAKEFLAAARIMQSSSKELSTLVADRV